MVSDVAIVKLVDLRSGRELSLSSDEVATIMSLLRDLAKNEDQGWYDRNMGVYAAHFRKWSYVTGLKDVENV